MLDQPLPSWRLAESLRNCVVRKLECCSYDSINNWSSSRMTKNNSKIRNGGTLSSFIWWNSKTFNPCQKTKTSLSLFIRKQAGIHITKYSESFVNLLNFATLISQIFEIPSSAWINWLTLFTVRIKGSTINDSILIKREGVLRSVS